MDRIMKQAAGSLLLYANTYFSSVLPHKHNERQTLKVALIIQCYPVGHNAPDSDNNQINSTGLLLPQGRAPPPSSIQLNVILAEGLLTRSSIISRNLNGFRRQYATYVEVLMKCKQRLYGFCKCGHIILWIQHE